jgi:thiol-disulfide isomerase/thioredoxin
MNSSDPDLQSLLVATLANSKAAGAVICLCADWCNTCRDYQTVFKQAADAYPMLAFRWLDIEDEADVLGDVDIETFPTLLIGRTGAIDFVGAVLPYAEHLMRLLEKFVR